MGADIVSVLYMAYRLSVQIAESSFGRKRRRSLEFPCSPYIAPARISCRLKLAIGYQHRLVIEKLITSSAVGYFSGYRLHFKRKLCGAVERVFYSFGEFSFITEHQQKCHKLTRNKVVNHRIFNRRVILIHTVAVEGKQLRGYLPIDKFGCINTAVYAADKFADSGKHRPITDRGVGRLRHNGIKPPRVKRGHLSLPFS